MPTINRSTLIAGGTLAAIVLAAVLFLLWPGWALGNDNGSDGSSTADNGQTATDTPVSEVSSAVLCPGTQLYAATLAECANTGVTDGTQAAKCPGDHEVKAGETYQVLAGCNVKGDVEINGRKEYDDDQATGLIVSCPNGCVIFAQWGANVSPRSVDDLKAEMIASGCGSKCRDVKVVVIDGASQAACDVSLPKGAKAIVPSGCIVSGDVEFASSENGPFKAIYDSDQTTGLVVVVKSDTWIRAPFGASVTNASVDDVVNAVKQTGCGLPNGCRVVNKVTVP